MAAQKKVSFFLGSMGRGGAERVISILSKDYAERGWETDIALLLSPKVEYQLHERTQVLDFTGKTKSRILRIPMWLRSIRKYVKDEKPDCIVVFAARINILVILACMGLKQKIVVSERNDPRHDGRGRIADWLTKILYRHVDRIVFQTKRAKVYFCERIQKNSVIIPNPISVTTAAMSSNKKKIVTVGRLTKQKNQYILLQAFDKIYHCDDNYTLELYGDGELKAELQQLADDLGIKDRVVFHGNVSNIHEQIADATMFVLSSDFEGLSNALLEAMMMGLPCISTNCAGADEYIEDGNNGLLVPVGDVDNLGNAILKYMKDDQLRKACAKQARKIRDQVSAEHILKKWHEVID